MLSESAVLTGAFALDSPPCRGASAPAASQTASSLSAENYLVVPQPIEHLKALKSTKSTFLAHSATMDHCTVRAPLVNQTQRDAHYTHTPFQPLPDYSSYYAPVPRHVHQTALQLEKHIQEANTVWEASGHQVPMSQPIQKNQANSFDHSLPCTNSNYSNNTNHPDQSTNHNDGSNTNLAPLTSIRLPPMQTLTERMQNDPMFMLVRVQPITKTGPWVTSPEPTPQGYPAIIPFQPLNTPHLYDKMKQSDVHFDAKSIRHAIVNDLSKWQAVNETYAKKYSMFRTMEEVEQMHKGREDSKPKSLGQKPALFRNSVDSFLALKDQTADTIANSEATSRALTRSTSMEIEPIKIEPCIIPKSPGLVNPHLDGVAGTIHPSPHSPKKRAVFSEVNAAKVPEMIPESERDPCYFENQPDPSKVGFTRCVYDAEGELIERRSRYIWYDTERLAFQQGLREYGRRFPLISEKYIKRASGRLLHQSQVEVRLKTRADIVTYYYMYKHEMKWKVKSKMKTAQKKRGDKERNFIHSIDF